MNQTAASTCITIQRNGSSENLGIKEALFKRAVLWRCNWLFCFVYTSFWLVSRQLEVIACLPSEILCVFPMKRHTVTTWEMIDVELEEEKREEEEEEEKIDGREREKEEEWYGCADSRWPFSLLHQQHRGYLYISVGCSAPLYKPLHTHTHTHRRGVAQGECCVLLTLLTFFHLLVLLSSSCCISFFFESFTHIHQDVSSWLRP